MSSTGNCPLGFGTEYEKFILREIASRIVQDYDLKSVCEYPANNLLGDNNEVFAGHNLRIDRLSDPTSTGKMQYDLVWNFCEIEQQIDPHSLIRRMLLLTRKYLLIIVQNRRNPGVYLHKIYHYLTGKEWDHGNIMSMSPTPVVKYLRSFGRIIQVGYFDVPWFILDIYESGAFLRKLVPHSLSGSMLRLKKSKFEEMPDSCKKYLAHHAYVLFEKS